MQTLGMVRRPGERWTRFAARIANAFGLVLVLVVVTYVLLSVVPYHGWGAVASIAVSSTCAVVALVSGEARDVIVRWAATLAGVAVVLAAIYAIAGGSLLLGTASLIVVLLLLVAVAEVLGTVIGEREVGFRTILGAISVYVILGLLFAFLYGGIARVQGGHFFQQTTQTGDLMYFSITTLTTTGYGNLIPAAQPGRMLSGLEMLLGQIFLVTLIAGLVSLWRPGARAGREQRDE